MENPPIQTFQNLHERMAFYREGDLYKLVVGAKYIKLIWVPDTFFVNEKIALFHQATTENQYLCIINTGRILVMTPCKCLLMSHFLN